MRTEGKKFDPVRIALEQLEEELAPRLSVWEQILLRCPALLPAIGLTAGIIVYQTLLCGWLLPAILTILCTAAGFFCTLSGKQSVRIYGAVICAAMVFFGLGMLRLFYTVEPAGNDIRMVLRDEPLLASLRGTVVSRIVAEDPNRWLFGKMQFSKPSSSFYLQADQILTHQGWQAVRGAVRVQVGQPPKQLKRLDRMEMLCTLSGFSPPANPGQFDFQNYMRQRGVYAAANVEMTTAITILENENPSLIRKLHLAIQSFAAQSLLSEMPDESDPRTAMAAALLLGDQGKIAPATYEAFAKTGLSHIISLSGSHLAIIAGMVWWVGKMLGVRKQLRAILAMTIIVLYAMAVPPRPPILRSVFICVIFFTSTAIGRKTNPVNSIAVSALLLFMLRPMDVFQIDCQLSYVSVIGILLFYKPIERWIERSILYRMDWDFVRRWPRAMLFGFVEMILKILAVGWAAWLSGAGLVLWHFGTSSPGCPLWTLIVSPIVPVILWAGFIKILVAPLLPSTAAVLGYIVIRLSDIFQIIVRTIADRDMTVVSVGVIPTSAMVCYYLAILCFFGKAFMHRRLRLTLVVICAAAGVGFFWQDWQARHEGLELTCFAVGHGQAVLLRTPDKKAYLFDAGSMTNKDIGGRVVVPYLKHAGIAAIDAAFISHADLDHYNGLPEIAAARPIHAVYTNQFDNSEAAPSMLCNFLAKNDIPIRPIAQFKEPAGDVAIRHLWPTADIDAKTLEDNNRCDVFLIEYAGCKILLCGDIEMDAQRQIRQRYPDLKADVMLLPHHGSTNTLQPDFVNSICTQAAVISCSKANVKSIYQTTPPVIAYNTAQHGAVTIKIKADGTLGADGFVEPAKR